MAVELSFKKYGVAGKSILVLHGLFGSGDNWTTLARLWSERFQVYTIDMRNHGLSPHTSEHTYQTMADDIELFVDQHHIQDPIILGHSMGGKAAMEYALRSKSILSKVIIVDIAPRGYAPHHQKELEAMHAVALYSLASRQDAEKILSHHLTNPGVVQFIMKGLFRTEDGQFKWRFNLPVLSKSIDQITVETRKGICHQPALFIKGEKSDFYIQENDRTSIMERFPNASIVTIAQAGHWVQAEQPQNFSETVLRFLGFIPS